MARGRRLFWIFLGLALVSLPGGAAAVPFFYAGSPLDPIDDTLGISVSISVPDSGTITDLNVSIELAETGPGSPDTWWDDLFITLTHAGTPVALNATATISEFGLFDIVFDDEALATLTDARALDSAIGPHQPDGLLSDFDGDDVNGLWELEFVDGCCNAESKLVSWSISGTLVAPEPSTLALLGLGLTALAACGRPRRRSRGAAPRDSASP